MVGQGWHGHCSPGPVLEIPYGSTRRLGAVASPSPPPPAAVRRARPKGNPMKINAGVNDWYSYIRQSNAMKDPSISALDKSVQVQEENASRYQDRVSISAEAKSLLSQVDGGDPALADDPLSRVAPEATYSPASLQSSAAASEPEAQAATRDGVAVDSSGPPWRVFSAGQPLTATRS